MKYRHRFHAGNFADTHKHVTLLALLNALQRKEKGFVYLDTHGGAGRYVLERDSEAASGIERLLAAPPPQAEELRNYRQAVEDARAASGEPRAYPGSALLAAAQLRAQDRACLAEWLAPEARQLERALRGHTRCRVETGDGFERLRAWLPPRERRGLILIDPPYEDARDFARVAASLADALQRFNTGVYAVWYPVKDERDLRPWHAELAATVRAELLSAQLWLYPRDSRVALNGSAMLIVNPPFRFAERMRVWLPELQTALAAGEAGGGTSVVALATAA